MILRKQEEVETHGINNTNQFQIKASSHAFRILSDGLYSDKISSIIRELSCNALDSHIANGNPEIPFQIHIPSKLIPHFHIRDYGIGLSEEDIMGLYSTYFASTKGQSNDFVGALGLGSKSPFSYTDSFTVESWFNNEKKTYAIFIGDEGVPNISKIYEEPSEEPSGLKISFQTKEEDVHSFVDKAKLLSEFDVYPDINIALPAKGESIYKTDKWEIRKSDKWSTSYYAKQGPVLYNINASNLPEKFPRLKNSLKIVLPFEMGDISFTASREDISFDEDTSKVVQIRFLEMAKELLLAQEEKIKELIKDKCIMEQYKTISKFNETQNIIEHKHQAFKELKRKLLVKYPLEDVDVVQKEVLHHVTDYAFLQYTLNLKSVDMFYLKNYSRISKVKHQNLGKDAFYLELDIKSHRESIKNYLIKNNSIKKLCPLSTENIEKLKELDVIDDSMVVKMSSIRIKKERVSRGTPKEKADKREYNYTLVTKDRGTLESKITKSELVQAEGYFLPLNELDEKIGLGIFHTVTDENIYVLSKALMNSNHKLKELKTLLKSRKVKNILNTLAIETFLYNVISYETKHLLSKSKIIKNVFNKFYPNLKKYIPKSGYIKKELIKEISEDQNYFNKYKDLASSLDYNCFEEFGLKFPLLSRYDVKDSEIYINAKMRILKKEGYFNKDLSSETI